MFKKCILILAASCMMYSCATQTESNPFLTEFQTPNGVPPFDKIKLEHYEPAFQKGIEEQNANIQYGSPYFRKCHCRPRQQLSHPGPCRRCIFQPDGGRNYR